MILVCLGCIMVDVVDVETAADDGSFNGGKGLAGYCRIYYYYMTALFVYIYIY